MTARVKSELAPIVGHTPGPWRAACCDVLPTETDNGRRFFDIIAGPQCRSYTNVHVSGFIDCGGKSIANVGFCNDPDREANARLIAAAPDLLEALVACNNRLLVKGMIGDPHDEAALARAKKAIARARGETTDA